MLDDNADWVYHDDYPISEGVSHAAFAITGTNFYICGGKVIHITIFNCLKSLLLNLLLTSHFQAT